MTNDERMSNDEGPKEMARNSFHLSFCIWASAFFRHSSFGIRHSTQPRFCEPGLNNPSCQYFGDGVCLRVGHRDRPAVVVVVAARIQAEGAEIRVEQVAAVHLAIDHGGAVV